MCKWFSVKLAGKYIYLPLFSIKYSNRQNKMFQCRCSDGSDSEEEKEDLIEVEAVSINVSYSIVYEDVSRVAFMII